MDSGDRLVEIGLGWHRKLHDTDCAVNGLIRAGARKAEVNPV
jgi:hypothetical protein